MKDIWYATSETGSFGPQRGHNTLVENHCSNTRPFLRLLIDWTIKVASYMSSRYYFFSATYAPPSVFFHLQLDPRWPRYFHFENEHFYFYLLHRYFHSGDFYTHKTNEGLCISYCDKMPWTKGTNWGRSLFWPMVSKARLQVVIMATGARSCVERRRGEAANSSQNKGKFGFCKDCKLLEENNYTVVYRKLYTSLRQSFFIGPEI